MARIEPMTREERVVAIEKAAVAFASDHGPLSAAIGGDAEARHEVAIRLFECLRAENLSIQQGPNWPGSNTED